MQRYAELHSLSNFSFLRGASHPHELVQQAHDLGYQALALTDECSLAGVVRAMVRADSLQFHLIIGTELRLSDGLKLVVLVTNLSGYQQLCRLITRARRGSEKGQYSLGREDIQAAQMQGCLALFLPDVSAQERWSEQLAWLKTEFPQRVWIGVELHRQADDHDDLQTLEKLGRNHQVPCVACGDVHMHERRRRILQDALTAIRHGCTVQAAGSRLFPNGERHLRKISELQQLYPQQLLRNTLDIAERCRFSLHELVCRYPAEDVPAGMDADAYLRQLVEQGLRERWPQDVPERVSKLIEHELKLIRELRYPHYFLTVYAIVRWARSRNILCQGRGSAANSAVCYALGITVVDPSTSSMLFERFVSPERNEPPDIDVDFEHQRREEVFAWIYQRYGRRRAALVATVIRYRTKSAMRDLGKALGLSEAEVVSFNQALAWWEDVEAFPQRLQELGFDPASAFVRRLLSLLAELRKFPRHLSQHVGGFVISEQALDELVPIENAAMVNRTVIQWDKDDIDAIGLFKVDCLALGMLSAIHRSFDVVQSCYGRDLNIYKILQSAHTQSREAQQVYSMLGQCQSMGVFQVESRAQMSMLPRMRPQSLQDLTIQVAIVRPGPIQGGMVHPYLNRRMGREENTCPPDLQDVLGRTLGIPLFQEQVMDICVKGAGFKPGYADQVRRSMAAWGREDRANLDRFEESLKQGLLGNGYSLEFAESIFSQIRGFAEYGFPESHAASFATLVYVSAWLKRFYPAAFLLGLLNSQPMGFYSASQLIQDFRRIHGVRVLPPDVCFSAWESQLEANTKHRWVVRLGLHQIKGLGESAGRRLGEGPRSYANAAGFFQQHRLSSADREALAAADALRSLSGHRHQAQWQAQGHQSAAGRLQVPQSVETAVALSVPTEGDDIVADYQRLGLSLRRHPLALLRDRMSNLQLITARQWRNQSHGRLCKVAGIVTNRQRPGTAQGIIFMTLEDETGVINLVIKPDLLESHRLEVLQASLLVAEGVNENREGVRHLLVRKLYDHSELLGRLSIKSRDFH